MNRKDLFVIRIGVSLEGITEVKQEDAAEAAEPDAPPADAPSPPEPSRPAFRPPRYRGRDDDPNQARTGDRRAMSDSQRRLLFRLAYAQGDKESALDRVLEALGLDRLEWATRADASRAIDALKAAAGDRPADRRSNGGRHA
jgi:hypothetical protein